MTLYLPKGWDKPEQVTDGIYPYYPLDNKLLDKYRTEHLEYIDEEDFDCGAGSYESKILPEAIGCKMDMLFLAMAKSLGARSFTITTGIITTIHSTGRCIFTVDENDIIQDVTIHMHVQYPCCGADMSNRVRKLKDATA